MPDIIEPEGKRPLSEPEIRQNRLTCLRALRTAKTPKICGSFVNRHWTTPVRPGPVEGCCALPVFSEALGLCPIDRWGLDDAPSSYELGDEVTRLIGYDEGSVYVISDSTSTFNDAANVLCVIWDIPIWKAGG